MKAVLIKVWHGLLAGVTSTEAVKQEKSLATLILTRVLVTAGAGTGLVKLVQSLLGA